MKKETLHQREEQQCTFSGQTEMPAQSPSFPSLHQTPPSAKPEARSSSLRSSFTPGSGGGGGRKDTQQKSPDDETRVKYLTSAPRHPVAAASVPLAAAAVAARDVDRGGRVDKEVNCPGPSERGGPVTLHVLSHTDDFVPGLVNAISGPASCLVVKAERGARGGFLFHFFFRHVAKAEAETEALRWGKDQTLSVRGGPWVRQELGRKGRGRWRWRWIGFWLGWVFFMFFFVLCVLFWRLGSLEAGLSVLMTCNGCSIAGELLPTQPPLPVWRSGEGAREGGGQK